LRTCPAGVRFGLTTRTPYIRSHMSIESRRDIHQPSRGPAAGSGARSRASPAATRSISWRSGAAGSPSTSRSLARTVAVTVGQLTAGKPLFGRPIVSSGSIPEATSRRRPLATPPAVFIAQGTFQTYSTSRWSA
jgi:hypothetical protein